MANAADRIEQFANRFVSKTKVLTARLVSSPRCIEINPDDANAVAFKKEMVTNDSEFIRMLDDLVKLIQDCETYIRGNGPLEGSAGLAELQRIAAAVGEMTTVVKEYTRQRERDTALPKWLTTCGVLRRSGNASTHVLSLQPTSAWSTNAEFLIGSRRFN